MISILTCFVLLLFCATSLSGWHSHVFDSVNVDPIRKERDERGDGEDCGCSVSGSADVDLECCESIDGDGKERNVSVLWSAMRLC